MITLREALARIRGVFGAGRRDDELSAELSFHREMLEAQHRARGLEPEAARRAARLDLGAEAPIAEAWRDQRGLPFADTLIQDVRYGVRMLRRTPGFTVAAVLTLAIGIGANTAIFSIVDAVLLRPLPYFEPERLVAVGDRTADGQASNVGFLTVLDWRERSRTIESFAMMRGWMPTLVVNGEAERLPAVRVSANYFGLMGVRPALGRDFSADDDRPDHWRVLLLSDALWRRRFNADPSIVGRTIVMNDRQYRVIGVMPAGFEPLDAERFYDAAAEIWAPIGYAADGESSCRSCRHLRSFGRLKRGVTLAQAQAEMNTIREQLRREHPGDYDATPIAVVSLQQALTGNVRNALFVLLAAVGFVLLIACANVANLLLARSVTRRRELALRAILGATRGRLVRQLLTESMLLGVSGAIAGILLAAAALRGLEALAPVTLPRLAQIAIDGRVLAFTAAVTMLTSLFFGLLPAWREGRAGAQRTLAIDSRSSVGGRSRARAALVMADLVFALVLLAGAGLMLRTLDTLVKTSPGFNPDRIVALSFSLSGQAYAEDTAVVAFQAGLLQQLGALPGVEAVALAGQVPFGGNGDCRGFHAKGRMKPNPVDNPCIERYGVTPAYWRLMGIPLLAGRTFTDADTATSAPVLVISESTSRLVFGTDSPIGAQVRIGGHDTGPWRTVVGVVADVHHEDLTAAPTPALYTPQTQFTDSFLVALLKSSASDPALLVTPARSVFRALDPSIPLFDIAPLPALVAKSSAERRFVMRLLAGFAAVAVFLAAIGLYGVVSHGVAQRTREVGVRVALGAQGRDVLSLILAGGARLVAAGVIGGLAAAAIVTRYLGTLVFGVQPTDPLTFAAAALILVVVALGAHVLPIRRALRIDPALALRAE